MRFSARAGGAAAGDRAGPLQGVRQRRVDLAEEGHRLLGVQRAAAAAEATTDRPGNICASGNGHDVVGMGMGDHGLADVVRAHAELLQLRPPAAAPGR